MSEIQNLVDALNIVQEEDAWHGPGLSRILSGVNADMALARPVAGTHTIWELLLHIQAWEDVIQRRLEGEEIHEPVQGDFPNVEGKADDAWKKTIRSFNETHDQLVQTISRLKPADLEKQAPGETLSIAFMLHGMVRHHVYHAGQIAILKKMLER